MAKQNDIQRAVAQIEAAKAHPDTRLSMKAIEMMTGWARPTIYRRSKDGSFPKPVAPGRWRGGDVLGFLSGGTSA